MALLNLFKVVFRQNFFGFRLSELLPSTQVERVGYIVVCKINQILHGVLTVDFVDSFAHKCLIVLGTNNNDFLSWNRVVEDRCDLERQKEGEWAVAAWLAILLNGRLDPNQSQIELSKLISGA